MNDNPRKIHYDKGTGYNHTANAEHPVLTTDEKKVTCAICLSNLGIKRIAYCQPMNLTLPPITPEQEARYKERKVAENKLREQFREQNWRLIDGLSPEEMDNLRSMMHGETPSPDPFLRKLGRPTGSKNRVPRKDTQ